MKLFEHTRALERGLDLANARHNLIASNIANIDTPGYKPAHLDFETALASASGQQLELRRTDPRHLGSKVSDAGVAVTVDLASERPDGNAVDAEREMVDLTRNSALFTLLVRGLSSRFDGLRAAIKEGQS